jgi:ABC-type transport system substrate-binding protein
MMEGAMKNLLFAALTVLSLSSGREGTGPFRLTKFIPRQRAEMERFDGYWGTKAKADKLVLLSIPEANTRVSSLLSGQVDWVEAPAPVAAELVPGLVAPEAFESIINVHFAAAPLSGTVPLYGLIGGLAEWVCIKPGPVSVTISAANRLSTMTPETIAATVRATFAATSAQEARRPTARTEIDNLALGGDWTATGLPATIEGAIRSGRTAANVILSST